MNRGSEARSDLAFFRNLVRRQIRQDYLENLTGFAWLFLQPLLLLAVYAFVFTTIFKSRVPDSDVGFVPFLAIAFWPWIAFSESLLKASSTITGNAALIGKVAFSHEQLPLAMVSATFMMHMAGYLAVLLVLQLLGTQVHWLYLPLALPVLALLWVFASGVAFFCSAIQVFVRDTAQILPPLVTFWFFMSPILYSPTQLPDQLAAITNWNPIGWFMYHLRELLLNGTMSFRPADLAAVAGVLVFSWLCLKFFRRFSGHFEDFL